MKKFLFTLLLAVTALSLTAADAEARRLGGGGNFGRQSSARQAPPPQSAPQQAVKPATPVAAAPVPASAQPAPVVPPKPGIPWRGILGGAALGLGMSALMSHFGMSGAMGSMLGSLLMAAALAAVVIFAMRLFKRPATASTGNQEGPGSYSRTAAPEATYVVPASAAPISPPAFQSEPVVVSDASADFDVPNFLRTAKTFFIRMQAAWDKADVNDIGEFTTPEMFAELKLQILERGASPNHTDVVTIAAEMLSVETVGDEYHASVKFVGVIKEAEDATAEPFTEIWNLSRPILGHNNWLLAGIQQAV